MAGYQGLRFKSLEEFFDHLPPRELQLVHALRDIVLNSIPNVREKLSYNVPYYSRHQRICFIWPASVPWGKEQQDGVLFGFCNGHLLPDELNYLDRGNRKQVYTRTFTNTDQVDSDILKAYLADALSVDEQLRKQKQ